MQIKDLEWLGVRTTEFDQTVTFFKEVMGLKMTRKSPSFAWFELPNGKEIEVFSPQDEDHTFFKSGPVVGFLVDDIEEARRNMEAAGIEFIGPIQHSERNGWSHFRGPDGNIYEIISRS